MSNQFRQMARAYAHGRKAGIVPAQASKFDLLKPQITPQTTKDEFASLLSKDGFDPQAIDLLWTATINERKTGAFSL